MGHIYARKVYKKIFGAYKGRNPPKTPKYINLQMPISQNEEMAKLIVGVQFLKYL